MNKKYRNLFQNLLLMFVTLIVFFTVFEIVIRVAYPDESLSQFMKYDSLLGWKNKANTQGRLKIPEYTSNVKINSKGIRDEEHEYAKGGGIFRILVLGDSMTWGFGVEAEERYTDVLEDMLGNNFETINMGTSGYGTDQEYLLLKEDGIKYNPDLVIFDFDIYTDACDVFNTVRYRYYSKSKFEIVNDELVLTNVPVPKAPTLYLKINKMFSWSRSYVFIRDKILSVKFMKNKLAETLQYRNHSKCDDSVLESEEVMHLVTKILSEANSLVKSNMEN